jgi:hypothetical protein
MRYNILQYMMHVDLIVCHLDKETGWFFRIRILIGRGKR